MDEQTPGESFESTTAVEIPLTSFQVQEYWAAQFEAQRAEKGGEAS